MKKLFYRYACIWALLLCVFNVAVFASPKEWYGLNKFGGAFWAGYIFITLAFFGQLAVSYFVFRGENTEKLFLHMPMFRLSRTGLVLTLIFGTVCMIIPNLPNWVGVILCYGILGLNAISVVKASIGAQTVAEKDRAVKAQAFFIRSLTADAESLLAKAQTDEIRAECKKVYEAIRYSDPMSDRMLSDIEGQITLKFAELSTATEQNNGQAVQKAANEVLILVNDRNKKCKLLK